MFDVLKGERGGGVRMDIVFQGGVCAGDLFAQSVSNRQVDSQMATPSADPCLALADAQLASGAEQAGPCRPPGTAKRRDLWTR